MSGYLHITAQRAKSRPCMVSSLNVTWISGAAHMSIFVRSVVPNVGWHDRVYYSYDYKKRVLGSDQRCCRKPTYYEPCKREKTGFCYNQLPQFSLRSCHGSMLLEGCKVTNAPNLHFDLRSCSFGGTSHVHLCQISVP